MKIFKVVYRLYRDDQYSSGDHFYKGDKMLSNDEVLKMIIEFRRNNYNESNNYIQVSSQRELRPDEARDLNFDTWGIE